MPVAPRSPAPAEPAAADAVRSATDALVAFVRDGDQRLVLAVSGGVDSMVLLHSVDRAVSSDAGSDVRDRISVATFDHGTGAHATAAARLVYDEARGCGFDVCVGHASLSGATEAEWRAARWAFLEESSPPGAAIATAHTRDDQLETVVMRVMRGAGARGLAGLAALSPMTTRNRPVIRPFLDVSRATLRAYAEHWRVAFIEDPSNMSRAHLRNRLRHDLLPAIHRLRPRFGEELLELADCAARWRAAVDAVAATLVSEGGVPAGIRVARHELTPYDSAALCVLWPAIAARAGITLDRRGTRRLAQFTTEGASGARMQLSGGIEVVRQRDWFVFRRGSRRPVESFLVPLIGATELDGWRFTPLHPQRAPALTRSVNDPAAGTVALRDDAWACELPAGRRLTVRPWRAGDRMRLNEDGSARRVKRFFADVQVSGPSRVGWPVVLADDEIVWIPGIRRGAAASERSGRPVIRYACERIERGHRYR
jgi:tRNA(Ile)-lysidine synthase